MRKKLLLADDSITIQKVVGIIFSSEDYELTIVDNGVAALAKARENIPDVLLLDAVMPGKTGYEVCEEIRRDPALKGIPILLMTGAFEPFDETKARQSGADDFISKPFESQHLTDKVLTLVELAGKRSCAVPPLAPADAEFVMPPMTEAIRSPQPHPAPLAPPPATAFAPLPPVESFDFFTMEDEPAPAEPPRPVPPPAQAEVPRSVPPPAQAEVPRSVPPPAQAEVPRSVPPPAQDFELEIVEGTSDDDLWGAFELEDMAVVESAEVQSDSFEIETLGAGSEEAFEPTILLEDGGDVSPPEAVADAVGSKFAPVEEEEFTFADMAESSHQSPSRDVESFDQGGVFEEVSLPAIEPSMGESVDFFAGKVETPAQELFDDASLQMAPEVTGFTEPVPSAGTDSGFEFALEEEHVPVSVTPAAPAALPAAQEFDFQFAPEEESVPAPEALAPVAPVAPAARPEVDVQFAPEEEYVPAPEVIAPAAPSAVGFELSEEQLAALVSKISRDILEKIAWEVVPDLAERIITEEIRKIKEGV